VIPEPKMPRENSSIYILFNAVGVATAYVMLGLSVWLAPVDLPTKGYWCMGVFLLTCALVNLVKYRLDDRLHDEWLSRQKLAEKINRDYVAE